MLDDVSPDAPLPVLGHSKGGALTLNLADAQPFRFRRLVNIDGIPFRVNPPDVPDRERTKMLADEVAAWLEHRRRAGDLQRKPGTIDELAARRARMNPRLERDWLRYLVTVGGRHDADGWRWKIDAARSASADSARGARSGRSTACLVCRCRSSASSPPRPS